MDEFGDLVESIGFKAHGKSSAPLADLKGTNKTLRDRDVGTNQSKSSYNSINPDDFLRSNPQNSGFDDAFGEFDLVFKTSSSKNYNDDDDVFGLMKTSSADHYDVLGNKVSPVVSKTDDLLGNFAGMEVKNNAVKKEETASEPADLLSGFAVKTSSLNGRKSEANPAGQSFSASAEDPFVMVPKTDDLLGNFAGMGVENNSVKKQETAAEPADFLSDLAVKTSSLNGRKSEANPAGQSFSAPAEDPFVMFERGQGSIYNGASVVDAYLDSPFSSNNRSNTGLSQSSTTQDPVYDAVFNNNVVPKQQNKASSVSLNNKKQASLKANNTDDFSYLFGMGVAPPSGEFQEIQGESEERRKARFNHHMTTRARMNNALNEKNKRDLQAQQEQDEKHRVAATLDGKIKQWAVGKEGNLRALLSSLQNVLWAGSGWQPISLADLITSTAVKKAYHKATLCVHPDKVQQKGASVQQKYIAEKVFDLLKESRNKFNAEEFKKH
ncbi:hypothetical protein L1987_69432 [Smallanthus sonchifolius]|uniref:Uncharacterized protein n=1 Tax=Smallanthus sonchifolius TaxID=185202 RepID=A0ACB9BAG3_9ASTR|nr:hypothetical protein L1987_69432 [Smallanthus sonchifolius]